MDRAETETVLVHDQFASDLGGAQVEGDDHGGAAVPEHVTVGEDVDPHEISSGEEVVQSMIGTDRAQEARPGRGLRCQAAYAQVPAA